MQCALDERTPGCGTVVANVLPQMFPCYEFCVRCLLQVQTSSPLLSCNIMLFIDYIDNGSEHVGEPS